MNLKETRPSILLNDEQYATFNDLFAQEDLPTATLLLPRWTKAGKPLKVKVRGLSVRSHEWIEKESAGKDGERDWLKWYARVLHKGFIDPQLSLREAESLLDRNRVVVDAICAFIWELSGLNNEDLDNAVAVLADTPPEPRSDTEADASAGSDGNESTS